MYSQPCVQFLLVPKRASQVCPGALLASSPALQTASQLVVVHLVWLGSQTSITVLQRLQ